MTKNKILVIGGRGFIGKAVCGLLDGEDVYTMDKAEEDGRNFRGSITNKSDLNRAVKGVDCVVNLVGLSPLRKPKGTTYEEIHREGVRNIVGSCKEGGVSRLVHISALGADERSDISFLRTKGEAEAIIRNSGIESVIFRPAIVFDKDNELIKMAADNAKFCVFPNIPAKIQPIFRNDIAKLVVMAARGIVKEGVLEAAGPDVMTIYDMAKKIYRKKGFPCIPLPTSLLLAGMKMAEIFGLFGITEDQIKSVRINSTSGDNPAKKYIELTRFDDWLLNSGI